MRHTTREPCLRVCAACVCRARGCARVCVQGLAENGSTRMRMTGQLQFCEVNVPSILKRSCRPNGGRVVMPCAGRATSTHVQAAVHDVVYVGLLMHQQQVLQLHGVAWADKVRVVECDAADPLVAQPFIQVAEFCHHEPVLRVPSVLRKVWGCARLAFYTSPDLQTRRLHSTGATMCCNAWTSINTPSIAMS